MFLSREFKKYFTNTSWLFLGQIIQMILTFISGVLVTKYLGPEQFGILSYVISFVSLFTILTNIASEPIIVRELVKNNYNRDFLLGTACILKLFGSFLLLFVLLITVQFTETEFYIKLFILIFASNTIFQSVKVINYYFQSQVTSKYTIISNIIAISIIFCLKLLLIYFQFPLIYFVGIHVLESFLIGLCLIYMYYKQNLFLLKWKFRKDLALMLLKNSWPLLLASLFISIYLRIDQIMLKEMLDLKAVGIYSVAVKITEIWYFIPMLICNSLFPAIVKVKEKSEELYNKRQQSLYNLITIQSFGIAILVSFFSYQIIYLIYGKEYIDAYVPLSIMIWSGIAVALGTASGKFLLAENLVKISSIRTLVGALTNIILNFILIPKYGINGAAIATLASYTIATFMVIFIKPTKKTAYMMIKSLFFGIFDFIKLKRK